MKFWEGLPNRNVHPVPVSWVWRKTQSQLFYFDLSKKQESGLRVFVPLYIRMSCSDSNSSYLEVTSARSLALLHVRFSACASKKFLWDLSFDDFCIFFSLDSYIIHSSLGFFCQRIAIMKKWRKKPPEFDVGRFLVKESKTATPLIQTPLLILIIAVHQIMSIFFPPRPSQKTDSLWRP